MIPLNLIIRGVYSLSTICRPGAGAGTAPDWLDSFQSSSAAHGGTAAGRGGHINEAREAVLVAARQLGSGPAKAAASAMIGLQVTTCRHDGHAPSCKS